MAANGHGRLPLKLTSACCFVPASEPLLNFHPIPRFSLIKHQIQTSQQTTTSTDHRAHASCYFVQLPPPVPLRLLLHHHQFLRSVCAVLLLLRFPTARPSLPSVVMAPPPTHSLSFGEEVCDAPLRSLRSGPAILPRRSTHRRQPGSISGDLCYPRLETCTQTRQLDCCKVAVAEPHQRREWLTERGCESVEMASCSLDTSISRWFLPTMQIGCHIQLVYLWHEAVAASWIVTSLGGHGLGGLTELRRATPWPCCEMLLQRTRANM